MTSTNPSEPNPTADAPWDGVICFGGEDWWYHNRGHFDMQIMRRMASRWPVLYINSIGMRLPKPGRETHVLRRIGRKLGSLRRGLTRVDDGFAVMSACTIPGRVGRSLTGPVLTRQIRLAARRLGIRRPLVWIACPTAQPYVDCLNPTTVVYQRTDRYESFTGVDPERIASFDRQLKARADVTVFCASRLIEAERAECRRAIYIDHGVDFDVFAEAGAHRTEPDDVAGIPHPRVGFVGGIDAHTFDPELFLGVARRLPDTQFVMVGGCSLPDGWCTLPNVHLLGRRDYTEVPAYMAASDVLIMPWRRGEWIENCHPVKLKEYLTIGRPVVTTAFAELDRYGGLVDVATTSDDFADAIAAALQGTATVESARELMRGHTWERKAVTLIDGLMTPSVEERSAMTTPASTDDEIDRVRVPASSGDRSAVTPVTRCIILAGGLRLPPVVAESGRCVLDLSLTAHESVLDHWVEHVRRLEVTQRAPIEMTVLYGDAAPMPRPMRQPARTVEMLREQRSLRGTAGAVRDAVVDLSPDEHLLIVEAGRYVSTNLTTLVRDHCASRRDVTVAHQADGSPSGVYLARCGAFREVSPVGYIDLKEQWLPRIQSQGLTVATAALPGRGAMPLRTGRELIEAAYVANGLATGADAVDLRGRGRVVTTGTTGLRVVSTGAIIGPDAVIVDSIVMPGAVVGPRAVIVRSLVCPETFVQAGSDLADRVVSVTSGLSDRALRSA